MRLRRLFHAGYAIIAALAAGVPALASHSSGNGVASRAFVGPLPQPNNSHPSLEDRPPRPDPNGHMLRTLGVQLSRLTKQEPSSPRSMPRSSTVPTLRLEAPQWVIQAQPSLLTTASFEARRIPRSFRASSPRRESYDLDRRGH
jgi:hypothetical protein